MDPAMISVPLVVAAVFTFLAGGLAGWFGCVFLLIMCLRTKEGRDKLRKKVAEYEQAASEDFDPPITSQLKVKAKYARPAVCQCGYSVFRNPEPQGTIYEVEPLRCQLSNWTCQGCGRTKIGMLCIWVERQGLGGYGWFPAEIFDFTLPPEFTRYKSQSTAHGALVSRYGSH